MLRRKNLKIPIEREVVDTITGEISRVPDNLIIADFDFGSWIKVTIIERDTDLIPLDGLGTQFVVFYVILKRVIWEDCTVDIGPSTRESITANASIKAGMIRKYLKAYVKSNLMKNLRGSSYMINPTFFFRGSEIDQKRLYKLYKTHGKKF